jgi:multiple sugar transport system ATP-binding protein
VAAIKLNQVSKAYPNGQMAVRDLTLDIADGELMVLVGPSGSGKSTVLRLIAGLEMPSAGQIVIGGRDVTRVAPQDRDLAMVFQSYALYPHMSVRDNLAFGLRVRHVDPARIAARVQATAVSLGIDTLLDRKPAQLSGGQRQRVALGRAIAREPQAFLLDEPLSNLDPILRVNTRTELALLHRRLDATMVYVTHDQEEAMTLGTRVAVMRNGAVEQVAAALDLFRRPDNVFVARFVGSPAMNLWRCICERRDTGCRAVSAGVSLDLGEAAVAPDGADVWVGIRPHDIELSREGAGDCTGRVEVIELLGAVTVLHLRVDGLPDGFMRVVAPADTRVAVNDAVSLRIRHERVHLFDGKTERRLN